MGVDGFFLLIGGMVICAAGYGFYWFINYMKENRKKVNENIHNVSKKIKNKL
jgi:hypothetical protein